MNRYISGMLLLLLGILTNLAQLYSQSGLSFIEDYDYARQWESRNLVPTYQGVPLASTGEVIISSGQAHFLQTGEKADKRAFRKLGTPLGPVWKIDFDFTPTATASAGVGHVLLALTAGTEQPYRVVTETVNKANPFFGSSKTDQDAIMVEYSNNTGDSYNDFFLRIGYKKGSYLSTGGKIKAGNLGFALGDMQYLRLELDATQDIHLSLFSDPERTQLVQQKTLSIPTTLALPTGLHVIQHSNIPQMGIDRWLTAAIDNLRIHDPSLPCVRCADQIVVDDPNFNRIISTTVRVPAQDQASVDLLSNGGDKWVNIAYSDGLGRPVQEVAVQGGTDCGQDLISYHQYDEIGREATVRLPFAHAGIPGSLRQDATQFLPDILQETFYLNNYPHYGSDLGALLAETQFESSSLSRVLEQGAPGVDWQLGAHTVNSELLINDQAIEALHPLIPFGKNLVQYDPKELRLTRTTDENGHVNETATNKLGQKIYEKVQVDDNGTFAYTMYVYDKFGRLYLVISPEGIEMLTDEGYSHLSNNQRDHFGYNYKYDERGRLIKKWTPSNNQHGWTYMVYNELDQLVLVQDPNQRQKSPEEWSFTKYDAMGRPVMTGIYRDSQNKGSIQLVSDVGNQADLFEVRSTDLHGYSNQSFPTDAADTDIHSITYFDDYDFDRDGSPDYHYQQDLDDFPANVPSYRTKGMITGVKIAVLEDNSGMPDWLETITFYDEFGRELQTQADNHLGGKDISTFSYTYAGELLFSKIVHEGFDHSTGPGQNFERSVTISNAFRYDHRSRLVLEEQKTEDQSSGGEFVAISAHTYDRLGQEKRKDVLFKDGERFLQEIDYEYNVRGWISKINDPSLNSQVDPHVDLFAMKLTYNGWIDPQYNGNIAAMDWQVLGPDPTHLIQRYSLSYDPMNRLTEARYEEDTGSSITNLNRYTVDNISYTLGGNILTLNRYGKTGTNSFGLLDQLDYFYEMRSTVDNRGNSNRLEFVSDAAIQTEIPGVEQFVDGASLLTEYTYDYNGNLISDANKEISFIEYNHFNKPTIILFSDGKRLTYTYSADGTKLRQTVFGTNAGNVITKITDYLGAIQYENDYTTQNSTSHIIWLPHSEGRVRINGTEIIYEGFLSDHLSNNRIVFADLDGDNWVDPDLAKGEVLQINHYYPFGMRMATEQSIISPHSNQYLFNGKEQQDELGFGWVDFGARMYDPTIARWNGRDPLAEEYRSWSSYNYTLNNPIRFTDFDGRIVVDEDGNVVTESTGETVVYEVGLNSVTLNDGTVILDVVSNTYEKVYIFADDGTRIEALKLIESKREIKTYSKKDGQLSVSTKNVELDANEFDCQADCHGYTFAENKLWINNNQVNKILKHDNYEETEEGNAEVAIFKQMGVVHSAKRNSDGTYNDNAGIETTEYNRSLSDASRGFVDVSNPRRTRFLTKSSPNRVVSSAGGRVDNGLRIIEDKQEAKSLRKSIRQQYREEKKKSKSP
ncbi:MAG: DUF6443 domain-containing protein [Bacteroidota bacterium]